MKKLHLIKLLLLTSILAIQLQCTQKNKPKEVKPYLVNPSETVIDSSKVGGGSSPHNSPNPSELDSLKQEAKKQKGGD